jgi:hypothetical protein
LHLLVLVIVFYLNWGQAVMSNETTIEKFQGLLVEDFLVMMPALTALMLRLVYAIAGEVADSELVFKPFVSPSIPDHIDTVMDGLSMKASAYITIVRFSKDSVRSLQQTLNKVQIHRNSNPKRACHLAAFCLRQLGQSVMNSSNFQSLPLLVVPTLTGEVAELEFDFGPFVSPSIAATSK